MNPYTFQPVFGVHTYPGSGNRTSLLAEAYSVFTKGPRILLAIARTEDVLFLCPSEEDPADGQFTTQRYTWKDDGKKKSVACMTFSPCGRWLVCAMANGAIEVIPVSWALAQAIGATDSDSSCLLFSTSEPTTIDLRVRDDCLGLPTCILWYETRQKRQMLIYSNKGGDILFVDLAVRRLSASLQAPQSIHNLEIIEEAAHDDIYLLVSGFTGTQWLVPLEQGSLTLRETLARIVPSELKELNVRGSVSAVRSGGRNCIGVLYEDAFRLFSTTNFGAPVLDIVLPESTFAVRYTDLITFSIHNQVFVSYSLNSCCSTDYDANTRAEFSLSIGKLPDGRFLGFVALPQCDENALPACLFVTETSVYLATPRWTSREFLANLLLADKKLSLIELYCQAVGLRFPGSCFDAVPALLERKAIERALQICNLSKAPLYDIAKQFIERGFASFILPHIDTWLLDGANKATSPNEEAKRELSQLAFELYVETCRNTEGLERNTTEERFKNYLLCNTWYDGEYCLKSLMKLTMYESALVVVKVHGLYKTLLMELVALDHWDAKDGTFLVLASLPGLCEVLLHPGPDFTNCYTFLSRLETVYTEIDWNHRVRFLALFDPEREEMKTLLETVRRIRKAQGQRSLLPFKSLLTTVVKFFLSSLISFLHDSPAAMKNKEALVNPLAHPRPIPVACGAEHAAVIASDGLVYAFGRPRHGCLGDRVDPSLPSSLPVPLSLPSSLDAKVIQVACGADYTLALLDNGSIYSWGSNRYGQLGTGRGCVQSSKPIAVDSFASVTKIESGQYHNFALDHSGNAWGWGWNLHRQIGTGNGVEDVFRPLRVQFGPTVTIKAISCGYGHTLFLTTDGVMYGCGSNSYGQLAMDDTKKTLYPTRLDVASRCKVPIKDAGNERFSLIASGYFHNVALSTRGRLFMWGATPQSLKFEAFMKRRKNHQQTRPGTSATTKPPDTGAVGPVNGLVDAKQLCPTLIDTSSVDTKKIVQLSCGFHHSLLRTDDGQVYTWGKGHSFQLGSGDKLDRPAPTLVRSVRQHITYAACGTDCVLAVDDNRLLWCWGRNDLCQLGFESLSPNEKNKTADRVLTIQRPNKGGQRTIHLPQDARSYVKDPLRVPALCSMWPMRGGNETETKLKNRYSASFLTDTLKSLVGYYDLGELDEICDRYKAKEVSSFAHLVNGNVGLSCQILLDRLIGYESNEFRGRVDQILSFYSELAEKCQLNASELGGILRTIFSRADLFELKKYDLDEFIERRLALWAPGIVHSLSDDPKSIPLKAYLKLRAVQLVRQGTQKRAGTKEKSALYKEVDMKPVKWERGMEDKLYMFTCGHFVGERKSTDLFKDVATDPFILRKAPGVVEKVQEFLDMDSPPSDACPVCLKKGVHQILSNTTLSQI